MSLAFVRCVETISNKYLVRFHLPFSALKYTVNFWNEIVSLKSKKIGFEELRSALCIFCRKTMCIFCCVNDHQTFDSKTLSWVPLNWRSHVCLARKTWKTSLISKDWNHVFSFRQSSPPTVQTDWNLDLNGLALSQLANYPMILAADVIGNDKLHVSRKVTQMFAVSVAFSFILQMRKNRK